MFLLSQTLKPEYLGSPRCGGPLPVREGQQTLAAEETKYKYAARNSGTQLATPMGPACNWSISSDLSPQIVWLLQVGKQNKSWSSILVCKQGAWREITRNN